ncbi:MAG: phenylacetate--CoA ligase family protein [Solirubrobacteraceae bacterium]
MLDAQAIEPDLRYPGAGPAAVGLADTIAGARRSPFFAERLRAAGIDGDQPTWEQWRAIPPTSKEQLRELPDFDAAVVIAPRAEVVEFWRSGGVTGRPLYYPRTGSDLEHAMQSFRLGLEIAGVTAADTVMVSFPFGIHPVGQMVARAAETIGAAVVWAGAGSQLPSAAQVTLLSELRVTVWCGMPSFGLHLANTAEAGGAPLSAGEVRLLVTSAEVVSPPKRSLLERLWGAEVRDVFGMTECTLMGAECGRSEGLHVWTESSFCEVLDVDTLAPVALGETGTLCVTPKRTTHATPFVRWLSGDLVRMQAGCDCAYSHYPRIVHSGRTAGFFKFRGVNIGHVEAEEALYAIDTLRDFRVLVGDERVLVELEAAAGAEQLTEERVQRLFAETFGVRVQTLVVQRGAVVKATADQVKAQRFVDQRAGAG